MTIRHLNVFRAVCEEGSFTKAADGLYMTQPAVSHSIRELEEEAGTKLFERLSKRIVLTQMGEQYLEKVQRVLEAYEALGKSANHLEEKALLRIGSSITIANFWLPDVMKEFKKRCPDTPVHIEVDSAKETMKRLRANEIDLAVVEGNISGDQWKRILFSHYALAAACGNDYRDTSSMTLGELAGEKLLLREKGSAVRDTFDSAMFLAGFVVHPVWTSVNSQALLEAVKQNLGITILPEILLAKELKSGALRKLDVQGLALQNENHVVFHRDKYLTEPMKLLISLVQD